MTRMEIEPFCSGKDRFSKDRELSVLSEENLIQMVSYPTFRQGVFIPTENDQYALADKGYDLLATVAKKQFSFQSSDCCIGHIVGCCSRLFGCSHPFLSQIDE